MTTDVTPEHLSAWELFRSPPVQDFYHHLEAAAGFTLPPSFNSIFEAHRRHFLDEPRPAFMAGLTDQSPAGRWPRALGNSMESVRSAMSAVLYHRMSLLRIERELLSFLDLQQVISKLGSSAFGGGNTQKLDFEYHGFVFAYRRALDYLARAISALLHQDFHSFRRLPGFLSPHAAKHEWVAQILKVHSLHAPSLETFLGSEDERSTRDEIAHYSHVSVGTININAFGIVLIGGGEELTPQRQLATVLDNYVKLARDILSEMVPALASGFPK